MINTQSDYEELWELIDRNCPIFLLFRGVLVALRWYHLNGAVLFHYYTKKYYYEANQADKPSNGEVMVSCPISTDLTVTTHKHVKHFSDSQLYSGVELRP